MLKIYQGFDVALILHYLIAHLMSKGTEMKLNVSFKISVI